MMIAVFRPRSVTQRRPGRRKKNQTLSVYWPSLKKRPIRVKPGAIYHGTGGGYRRQRTGKIQPDPGATAALAGVEQTGYAARRGAGRRLSGRDRRAGLGGSRVSHLGPEQAGTCAVGA